MDAAAGGGCAGRAVRLEAVTPAVVSRYAAERRLEPEALDDLHGTLAGLRAWARGASR